MADGYISALIGAAGVVVGAGLNQLFKWFDDNRKHKRDIEAEERKHKRDLEVAHIKYQQEVEAEERIFVREKIEERKTFERDAYEKLLDWARKMDGMVASAIGIVREYEADKVEYDIFCYRHGNAFNSISHLPTLDEVFVHPEVLTQMRDVIGTLYEAKGFTPPYGDDYVPEWPGFVIGKLDKIRDSLSWFELTVQSAYQATYDYSVKPAGDKATHSIEAQHKQVILPPPLLSEEALEPARKEVVQRQGH